MRNIALPIDKIHLQHLALLFARLSLGLIFIWFGALKLTGVSPVRDVIAQATPFIMQYTGLYTALALFEIAVGIVVFIPILTRAATLLIIGHLLFATGSVIFSPQAFINGFPVLSVVGEFVIKNLALISVALLLMVWPKNYDSSAR